jgi:predicted phage terminase large subunit-like protein
MNLRESFKTFATRVKPDLQWYQHVEAVGSTLQRVADGEIKRLMIFMPPRHGKTELTSKLFTGYYLSLNPDHWIGLASYGSDLAAKLSRTSRDYLTLSGGKVRHDVKSGMHWETPSGGGFWSSGVGGSLTGKGGHLLIVDDPIKNDQEANSQTVREAQKEWYQATFYTRAEPNAAIIIIQTRWHEDDLSGWLLEQERISPDNRQNWTILNMPAIMEEPRYERNEDHTVKTVDDNPVEIKQFPENCHVIEDLRDEGQPLCPERYGLDELRTIERVQGPYYFGALYQQRPTARAGSFFQINKFKYIRREEVPTGLRICRGWDYAATEDGGDWTAGVKIGMDADGFTYILDVVCGQWDPADVEAAICRTAVMDGPSCLVRLVQDRGQAGKFQCSVLIRRLVGYQVRAVLVSGDKETRAQPFAAQVNAGTDTECGNVRIVKAPWNESYVDELREFPRGKHDDQVDASADAFTELAMFGNAMGGASTEVTSPLPPSNLQASQEPVMQSNQDEAGRIIPMRFDREPRSKGGSLSW